MRPIPDRLTPLECWPVHMTRQDKTRQRTVTPSSTSVTEYPKVFRNWWGQTKNQRGRLIDFPMLIGHVRWIGLLANVWCSNHSEFSEKKYATRSFTLRSIIIFEFNNYNSSSYY